MQESINTPTVSREHFLTTVKGLRQTDAREALDEALLRLPSFRLRSGSDRIPLGEFHDLIAGITASQDQPLLLARAYSQLNYQPALFRRTFLAGALSLQDGISLLCRYIKVSSDTCALQLAIDEGSAKLRVVPCPNRDNDRELLSAMVYAFTRILVGLGVRQLDHVALNHTPPVGLQQHYQDLFPTPVRFGAGEIAIHFPAGQLSSQLGWEACPAERLAKRERRLIRLQPEHRWPESVEVLLPILSRQGEVHIDHCAGLLAVSRRTLQRRIQAEGQTFRDLVDRTRRKLAGNYLARGYSNDSAAGLLGYRQSAQFYRAFREWYGCSPSDYRKQMLCQ